MYLSLFCTTFIHLYAVSLYARYCKHILKITQSSLKPHIVYTAGRSIWSTQATVDNELEMQLMVKPAFIQFWHDNHVKFTQFRVSTLTDTLSCHLQMWIFKRKRCGHSQYQVMEQLSSSELLHHCVSSCRSEIVSYAHQLFIYKRLCD